MRGVRVTRSIVMLPTITIGLRVSLMRQPSKIYSGASATAPSPNKKATNISTSKTVALRGAPANSCHTNTPQHAETIVAPWPMLYETAGPTRCAPEARKFATPPVHQIAPPSVPARCQPNGAFQ